MKKRSIIAVLLLSAMVILSMSSCAEPDVKTTVHLTITVGTKLIDEDVTVSTSADNKNGPSVIDVLHYMVDNKNTPLEFNDKNNTLIRLGNYYSTDYDNVTYLWTYTINGVEPKEGKADTNYVKEGDKIEYSFMAMTETTPGSYEYKPYDTSTGIFEEILAKGDNTKTSTDAPEE